MFKDLKCLSRTDRAEAWHSICALHRGSWLTEKDKPVTTEPSNKRSYLKSVPESSSEEDDCIKKCVECYKAEPSIGI